MTISRRKAIYLSGSTLAGLSIGALKPETLRAATPRQEDWPDQLVERPRREGFPVDLPLEPDGSAPEHDASAAGPITPPLMWRSEWRQTPDVAGHEDMAIRIDTRGLGRLGGTLRFSDLEALPQVSRTFLMQCGAPNPRGIVTWGGVRFSDFAEMLGLHPGVHYCRFDAVDGHYVDEDMTTLTHPQVMLAWMMNGEPITPDHGAPLRLVIPFRYGNRSIKAISGMTFSTPALPARG